MALANFAGATAVITGAASGIGLATTRTLYSMGANVVLADINEQGLRTAANQLSQTYPQAIGHIISQPTDVTSEAEVRELMKIAASKCGRIDLVVTSAGIGRGGSIDTFTAREMRQMMDINFMGTYHCIQQALPTMRQQGGGHFVCLSSVAGKLGNPFLSGYCASKWAVRGFTSAVRAELEGSGIGITTVYPAWVDTPMIHQEADPIQNMNVQALLTADEVATAMLQAVQADQRDLTLAPNPDIARALQVYATDPDKAERKMGAAALQALAQARRQEK